MMLMKFYVSFRTQSWNLIVIFSFPPILLLWFIIIIILFCESYICLKGKRIAKGGVDLGILILRNGEQF